MNRGRIQAQGDIEKSDNWALTTDHFKSVGLKSVENVEMQLTPSEKKLRKKSLEKCKQFIKRTPSYGITSQVIKSYSDNPSKSKIRIDIEVRAGTAFKDDIKK